MGVFSSIGHAIKGAVKGIGHALGGLAKGVGGLFRGQKIPDIPVPDVPAQPLQDPMQLPEAPSLGESDAEKLKRRRGKKSLRIDLGKSAVNTGGGGSGANIV